MTRLAPRPLTGLTVGVSLSESADAQGRGFTSEQINRTTVQVVAGLLGQGVSIAFGHDWRPDGVMEVVHAFALQVQQPADSAARRRPLITNLIPWPDKPYLREAERELLAGTLRVDRAGLPGDLMPFALQGLNGGTDSRIYRYLRARGLTHLREQLSSLSAGRICLGGTTSRYAGRYPGVVEEAYLELTSGKPLFVSAVAGGASQQIIDAILGKPMPPEFCPASDVIGLYRDPPVGEATEVPQRQVDREQVWQAFREAGVRGLSRLNRLSLEENDELFHTRALERFVELVLTGLARLKGTA